MRRAGFLISLVGVLGLLTPVAAHAATERYEWRAIQLLNQHRVELGLGKVFYRPCLARAAEAGATWSAREVGAAAFQSEKTLIAIKAACGMQRLSQISYDDHMAVDGSVDPDGALPEGPVAAWSTPGTLNHAKCKVATHSAIGIARVRTAAGVYIWYALLGTPTVP